MQDLKELAIFYGIDLVFRLYKVLPSDKNNCDEIVNKNTRR